MFGLATTLTGMDLLNPISLGAGAVFGGKSVRDESRSMLKRRQAVAKSAVQRHVDEVFVRLNKDAKDSIRRVQRVKPGTLPEPTRSGSPSRTGYSFWKGLPTP